MEGNFKGFAMLRQMTLTQPDKLLPGWENVSKPQPMYIEVRAARCQPHRALHGDQELRSTDPICGSVQGYGFVPPSQVCVLP